MSLWIHDKLYTFYDHFLEQIERRSIQIAWVEEAMLDPESIDYSKSTGRYLYDKFVPDAKRRIRVVVDEDQEMIVTAHYLSEKKSSQE